ncbi:HTH DNA binding domain-containing protein [Ruegeria halocynthiae]|uniref:HTH DNA binding domain-containing protein n=1 Tax=Ruegeria halocynthiae TaxID=985054 RepID=A0A1H3E5S5_9RHOB|nr:helix-turn-helix domain-containing protein [Ruegeria halocynthiae]SDX73608.1 HTH DNA binding domain-containing protein [Ruegeria halocynthiae]
MKPPPLIPNPDEEADEEGPRSIYDTDPPDEEDLWFLPPADDEDPEVFLPSMPRPDQPMLFDPRDWRMAQSELAAELADLAVTFGALDERLRAGPRGWGHRLALMEVSDLGWWTGDRISVDRLALWTGLRIGATSDDVQALYRAGWAVRRLSSGAEPSEGGWEAGLTAFLDRQAQGFEDATEAVIDLAEVMGNLAGLHPVTQAAVGFHAWRALSPGIGQDTEAAIIAARHAAGMGRKGALFMPLSLSGPGALRGAGTVAEKLAAWIRGAGQASLAALLHLERINAWEKRAREATSGLSGRTPPVLIDVLAAWPMVSAPLAEELTQASRAAVQRNLDRFSRRGLIREVTGQGRYRVWTAAL